MIILQVGQALMLWRKARGLSQEELARRARMRRPNLSAIERGRREASVRTVRMVAAALDIRPGLLVDGVGPAGTSAAAPLSREAMERVADAVVSGRPAHTVRERALAASLRDLVRNRALALRGRCRAPRRGRRTAEAAWVRLESALPPAVLESLLQRVLDRQGALRDPAAD